MIARAFGVDWEWELVFRTGEEDLYGQWGAVLVGGS